MQRWPWRKILMALSLVLIVISIVPFAYLIVFGSTHNFKPLSMQLPLRKGVYTSPSFNTDLNDDYQIDLVWRGSMDEQMHLDLDWKIVDAGGAVMQQGSFHDRLGGNTVTLGSFKPGHRRGETVVLSLPQDAQGMDDANTHLEVGVPEEGLDLSYAFLAAMDWAGITGGPGVILLIVLLVLRAGRRNFPEKSSRTRQTP